MPPKRKAAAVTAATTTTTAKGRGRGKAAASAASAASDPGPAPKKAAGRGKGKKKADEAPAEADKPSTARQAITTLQASSGTAKKKTAKPDSYFPNSTSAAVVEDYDCMLNQTNIGQNNNKYYVIQVLAVGASYFAWNRWGRVGEPGQNAVKGPTNKGDAIADFKKKFKDKTGNDWDKRANFTAKSGKYTLIEMDGEEEEEEAPAKKPRVDTVDGKQQLVAASKLDAQTQSLMKFIFDNDMFRDAMKSMDIDVKKMPLGKLSKSQIAKGFEVLEEIEQCLNSSNRGKLNELSSRFYTLIPHDFGRKVPPVIGDAETLRNKMDMLLVLGDIELAQQLNKEKDKSLTGNEQLTAIPNPLDVSYDLLECDLKLVDKTSANYKIIENYMTATGYHDKSKIQNVWEVRRKSEGKRFNAHDKIDNRKLLWHGTKVAVVAAILKGGLRIMPHSGGRMGKGIYFASEQSKSAGYVGYAGNGIGVMFLNEVALGKEHHVTVGDSRLTVAPPGHDSIIAIGSTEPDPKKDVTIMLDGKKVTVPQGKPIQSAEGKGSHFSQSEYLIYKESQNYIRYMLTIKFN